MDLLVHTTQMSHIKQGASSWRNYYCVWMGITFCAKKKPHTSLVHNVTVWVCFVDLGDIWRCGFHSDLSHRTRYRGTKQTRWGTASHEEWLNSMDVRVLQTATCPQKGGWLRLLWLVIILDYSASTLYRNISLAYINKNYYNNVNSECILCVTLQI